MRHREAALATPVHTKEPISLDGYIIPFVLLGDLSVGVWFETAGNLQVDILFRISSMDRSIHEMFPS